MTEGQNRRKKSIRNCPRLSLAGILCLSLCLSVCLAGCGRREAASAAGGDADRGKVYAPGGGAGLGSTDASGGRAYFSGQLTEDQAGIELLEPVQLTQTWEEAAFRNLYDSQVITAAVYPAVEEYSFAADGTLEQFEAYPGDAVEEGDVLAGLNREPIDRSVEDMEERIQAMEEEYQEYCRDTQEKLAKSEAEAARLREIAQPAPEDSQATESGSNSAQPAPEDSQATVFSSDTAQGEYRILAHQNDTLRQQLQQRTELYELDHAYLLGQLEKLREEREQYILKSAADGEVTAISMIDNGQWIAGGRKLIAVGDMSRKLLKCEYISQSVLTGAEEIYAVIQGKRYEIRNVPLGSGEYTRLTSRGETVYSTFEIEDADELRTGDFAVIVIMKNSRRNVLAVPGGAVSRNGLEYYVYKKDGEDSVKTAVTIGMSDGAYTEICSGLEEGDQVLVKESDFIRAGTGQVTLTKGDFAGSFSGQGVFYYPCTYRVTDPISRGTAYFQEYQVSLYQYVREGDVIASVRVQEDEVALQRSLTRLTRLRERLADLIRQGEEENAAATRNVQGEGENAAAIEAGQGEAENAAAIRAVQEEIAALEAEIAAMNEDFAAETIVADHDGIVVELAEHKAEDLLRAGETIAVIARQDNCYVIVENQGLLLNYGNEVTVSYQNTSGQQKSVSGRVANVAAPALSGALASQYALIRVPAEAAGEMSAVAENDAEWNFRTEFKVTGTARQMNGVVLVPKEAVWSWKGQTYVIMMDETGRMKAQSFVAGGYDYNYYWVAEGLTEGMVLCLK